MDFEPLSYYREKNLINTSIIYMENRFIIAFGENGTR